ncbi:MAG: hypothetical protein H7321_07295, partial [Bacteroidia bacterium]|nr:hypothetical protein [Bacteroidia bacterium]
MPKKIFYTLVIAMHIMCAMRQIFFEPAYTRDSIEYINAAQNLENNGILYSGDLQEKINDRLYTKRPAGYPLILIATEQTGNSLLVILILQNILSMCIVLLVVKISEKISPGRSWILMVILVLFSPAQIIYANMIMSEIWLETVVVYMAYILILKDLKQLKNWLFIGLLIVAGMLLKPVFSGVAVLFTII